MKKRGPERSTKWSSRIAFLAIAVVLAASPAAAKKRVAEVRVKSKPAGALVSMAEAGGPFAGVYSTVVGETPLIREFEFPKKHGLLLRFEKRGYEPVVLEIQRDATEIDVELLPATVVPSKPENVEVLAVVRPEFEVTRRGFASEREDEEAAEVAIDAFIRATRRILADDMAVVEVDSEENRRQTRVLWRDVRTRVDTVDPIRLSYLTAAPVLEGRSAAGALDEIAEDSGADAVLFITGKATVETGGMKAGKIGIMAAGTASSFASGYSSAMSSGGGFFTYNVYVPDFAEGLVLEALVIDLRDASIRWANKGLWQPIPVDRPDLAEAVVADLLSGLVESTRGSNQQTPNKEGP